MAKALTLCEAIDLYLTALRARENSASHLATVKYRMGRFARGKEARLLRSITGDEVVEFFQGMQEAGLASGTMAGHKQTQLAFWRFCAGRRWCSSQAAAPLRTKKHRYSFRPVHSRAARPDDFAAVMGSLRAFAEHRKWHPRDVRDAALVSLAVDSGKRRGELWNLRRVDVLRALGHPQQLEGAGGRTVYHMYSNGKTGEVTVRFYEESAELLRRWLEVMPPQARFVFVNLRTGQQLREDALHLGLLRVCEFAGVKPFRFHAIRKRVITDAIATTGDAKIGQLLAGHSDERMTQQHYNDVLEGTVDAAAARLQDRYRGEDLAAEFFAGRRGGRAL